MKLTKARARPKKNSQKPELAVGYVEPPNLIFEPARTSALRLMTHAGSLNSKLTTIIAPVGYGKTVAMAMTFMELRRAGKLCVWYGLDDRDVSADNVIRGVASQLNGAASPLHSTRALLTGDESVEQRIEALVNLVKNLPLPLSIFLDNLNCCTDPMLGRLLDRLCFATPSRVQLVISSVTEPLVNTARAELERTLTRVTQSDLSFDRQDVEAVLGARLCRTIGTPGVDQVLKQTEGWPAAVRMVQIILDRADDPSEALGGLSGSHEALADLLNRKVLSQFSPGMRAFMLGVSQLRRFSAELCDAIWSDEAKSHFEELLRQNLLVISLDQSRTWYRLHGLLKEFLAAEAERVTTSAQRSAILRSAAAWCEHKGQWRQAVEYALAGEAYTTAQRILDEHAVEAVRDLGDIPQFIAWVHKLDACNQQIGPITEYWFAWALAFRRRYDDARQRLSKLEERVGVGGENHGDMTMQKLARHLSLLRISIDSLTDNAEDAQIGALEWLRSASRNDDPFEICAAYCIVGCTQNELYNFVEAREALQSAREKAFQTHSAYVDGWVSTYVSLVPIAEGSYSQAYAALVAAIGRTQSTLPESNGVSGMLALAAAKCASEMGLDEEAKALLATGLAGSRTQGFLEVAACGLNAAITCWQGDPDSPYHPAALRDIADAYPLRLSRMLSCFIVRRLLVLGRIDEAVSEARRSGIDIDRSTSNASAVTLPQMQDLLAITRAELMIATAQLEGVKKIIRAGEAQAKQHQRMAKLVHWRLLSAIVALQDQQVEQARRAWNDAIRVASKRRIVRPFLNHARALSQLNHLQLLDEIAFALPEDRLFFKEIVSHLAKEQANSVTINDNAIAPCLLSRLTARELDLLKLISIGLTNEQIAGRLDISLTTVKWHLQNVFGKMNVSNRSTAVAHARHLKLIA